MGRLTPLNDDQIDELCDGPLFGDHAYSYDIGPEAARAAITALDEGYLAQRSQPSFSGYVGHLAFELAKERLGRDQELRDEGRGSDPEAIDTRLAQLLIAAHPDTEVVEPYFLAAVHRSIVGDNPGAARLPTVVALEPFADEVERHGNSMAALFASAELIDARLAAEAPFGASKAV